MVDIKTIQKIAHLARLHVDEHEAQLYSEQLSKVLNHFEQIASVDTSGVEPLITPVETELVLRPDQVDQSISTQELLQNAPDKMGQLFKVPPVL